MPTIEMSHHERYVKKWREENPEKYREQMRRHRERHKEKRAQQLKEWRSANPDRLAEYKERRKTKPGERQEYSRAYYESEKGRVRVLLSQAKRRAASEDVEFDLTAEWFDGRMQKCEVSGIELSFTRRGDGKKNPWAPSIDRIIAGGPYSKDNCRIVCWAFNMAKNDFPEEDFERMARAYISQLDAKADKP